MSDPVDRWLQQQRLETRYSRSQFMTAAKAGAVDLKDLIAYCEDASRLISRLETEIAELKSNPLGYTP